MGATKSWVRTLLAAGLLVLLASPALAGGGHGHGYRGGWGRGYGYYGPRVVVGVGPGYYGGYYGGYWGGPYWGPRYYAPYYVPAPVVYPVYTAPPPRVIVQEPQVYIERESQREAEIEQQLEAGSWYYCQSSGAYYPNVQTCSEPWVKVPPRP